MPHPGLGQINELTTMAREAGLDIKLEVSSSAVPLPSAVGSTAYRILQGSIINVIRHVGPTRLADDQVLVRSGFKGLLDVEHDITVVGEAANGAEATRPGTNGWRR